MGRLAGFCKDAVSSRTSMTEYPTTTELTTTLSMSSYVDVVTASATSISEAFISAPSMQSRLSSPRPLQRHFQMIWNGRGWSARTVRLELKRWKGHYGRKNCTDFETLWGFQKAWAKFQDTSSEGVGNCSAVQQHECHASSPATESPSFATSSGTSRDAKTWRVRSSCPITKVVNSVDLEYMHRKQQYQSVCVW